MIGTAVYWSLMKMYNLIILLASLFNPKAKKWIKGRKKIFSHIQSCINNDHSPRVWFHCSSLGEFEQARPVIEALKEQFPDYKIILTFFSPSGYEVRKNYNLADWVFYLPLDTPRNAQHLVKLFNPTIALFAKYDFWYFILRELKRMGVKVVLFSAIFRQNQLFFNKLIGGWYRKLLFFFDHIFVQDKNSFYLLKNIGIQSVEIAGDTRFDRVVKIAQKFKPIPCIEPFINEKTIVAGSTWEDDDKILANYINTHSQARLIIAPHEVTHKSLHRLMKLFKEKYVLYTDLAEGKKPSHSPQVIIINTIGLLAKLYRYGAVTYVGGGFGHGIHNLLEAVVYGKPVIFGPNHEKFKEALDLIDYGVGFCIHDEQEATQILDNLLTDPDKLKDISHRALRYIYNNTGATEKIISWIIKNI